MWSAMSAPVATMTGTVTAAEAAKLYVGMPVYSTIAGIPAGTTVSSVSGTTVTLSAAPTAALTAAPTAAPTATPSAA